MKPTRRRLLQLAAVVPVAGMLPAPPPFYVKPSLERAGMWSRVVTIAECCQCGDALRGAGGWPLRLPWTCACGICTIARGAVSDDPIVMVRCPDVNPREVSCDVFRPDLLWGGKMIGDPLAGGWTLGVGHCGKPWGNP